jgi:transcriptional antiterminator RfaH
MPIAERAWFCVRTRHKHERVAAQNLRQLAGVDVFYPRFSARRLMRGRAVRVSESLFPNYVLAQFAFPSQLELVRYARGVKEVIHFGKRWPTVPEELIADLREQLDGELARPIEELVVGDEVIIAAGVCAGHTARVQVVMPAQQRLQVLYDILGRSVRLVLPMDQVVPVNPRSLAGVRAGSRPGPVAIT